MLSMSSLFSHFMSRETEVNIATIRLVMSCDSH